MPPALSFSPNWEIVTVDTSSLPALSDTLTLLNALEADTSQSSVGTTSATAPAIGNL